jgi:type II secretory pathway pseudopilin PulG
MRAALSGVRNSRRGWGSEPPGRSAGAFTLLETLVAMAVLVILAALVLRITDSMVGILRIERNRLDSLNEGRNALDRFAWDWGQRIKRKDLPFAAEKRAGNDALGFYSMVSGDVGSRSLSWVAFSVGDADGHSSLLRAAKGAGWDGLTFSATQAVTPSLQDGDFDVLSDAVFRVEYTFRKKDGTVTNGPLNPWDEGFGGVVMTVAVLDSRSRQFVTPEAVRALAGELPDPAEGETAAAAWRNAILSADFGKSSGVPDKAARAVRVFEREFAP